jgi:predicted DNA repair protein MutK
VEDEPFFARAIILIVVAFAITALVYGAVGLIVKMDDIGLHLAEKSSVVAQKVGRGLVVAMPIVLQVLSSVGIVAMLWVGGHILLVGVDDLGWHWPYEHVHHWEKDAGGGAVGWLINTSCSAVIGLVVGAIAVAVMHVLPFKKAKH